MDVGTVQRPLQIARIRIDAQIGVPIRLHHVVPAVNYVVVRTHTGWWSMASPATPLFQVIVDRVCEILGAYTHLLELRHNVIRLGLRHAAGIGV